jgi:hypothetical protein
MIKTLLLVISAITVIGCSSSNDTPAGFVLGYGQNPYTTTENQRAFEVFPLKVVNNGVGLAGVTVHYTVYQTNSTKTDTIPHLSDANGEFGNPAFPLDTMTGVTFYATKDSMKSNTLAWHR